MRALFDRLRVAYDYVIVDLTPLVPRSSTFGQLKDW